MKNTTGLYKHQRDNLGTRRKLPSGQQRAKLVRLVQAKCIGCGAKRDIFSYEVAEGDHPCCDQCGMPMIAERAVTKLPPSPERDKP